MSAGKTKFGKNKYFQCKINCTHIHGQETLFRIIDWKRHAIKCVDKIRLDKND